jgi:hypothetical protein
MSPTENSSFRWDDALRPAEPLDMEAAGVELVRKH